MLPEEDNDFVKSGFPSFDDVDIETTKNTKSKNNNPKMNITALTMDKNTFNEFLKSIDPENLKKGMPDDLLKHMNYKYYEKKLTHNNFNSSPLLPFQTDNSRVKFDNGFNSILGEFTRIELNKKWDNNFDVNQIIFRNCLLIEQLSMLQVFSRSS